MVCHILLVEDDDVAAESIVRSMKHEHVHFPVTVAEDGLVALEILNGTHPTKKLAHPYIVLLDLNMPRMNGFEFLNAIREDNKLRSTIIFVLTTSSSEMDRSKAYHANIAGYMVKDAVGPQFSKLFQLLKSYAETVLLPDLTT
jgi:CheY-like chemotaxis protein